MKIIYSNTIKVEKKDLNNVNTRKYVYQQKNTETFVKNIFPEKDFWGFPRNLKKFKQVCNTDLEIIYQTLEKQIDKKIILNKNFALRENQVEVLQKMQHLWGKEHFDFMIQAPTGFGKEQPYSEPVLTPKGWVKMEDLKVGEYVIGSDGKPKRILQIFEQGEKDVYTVYFTNGSKVKCGKEHLWEIKRKGGILKTVKTTEELIPLVNKKTFDKRFNKSYYSRNYQIKLVKPITYSTDKSLKLDPYLLGVLLGDGGLTINVTITLSDINIINSLEPIVKKYGCTLNIKHIFKNHFECSITKNEGKLNRIKEILKEYDLIGKKSIDKHIPNEYLTASYYNRLKLLQGIIDTDGYHRTNTLIEITTSSKLLKNGIIELAKSLGIYVSYGIKNKPFYRNKNGEKIYCKKSYRIYLNFKKTFVSIERIEKETYKEKSRCIMIDSKDHLYVTNDFILTHNTFIIPAILEKLQQKTTILVDMTMLAEQMFNEISENCNADVIILKSYEQELADINIVTVQLLNKNPKLLEKLTKQTGLVILDEAHISGAETIKKTVQSFPAKYRIGLSATPSRSDGLDEILTDTFSNVVIQGKGSAIPLEIHSILSNHYFMIMTNYKKDLDKVIKSIWLPFLDILVKALMKKKKSIMIAVDSNEIQNHLANKYKAFGTAILNGKTSKKDREQILKDYESEKIKILIGYKVLYKGISIPRMEVLINIFGATTKENLEQLIGRLTRSHPKKEKAIFIDFGWGISMFKQKQVKTFVYNKMIKTLNAKVKVFSIDKYKKLLKGV